MMVKTIHVESLATSRDAAGLASKVESSVDEFLKEKKGELDRYELHGTVLDQAGHGRTLVTIYWNPKSKK